MADPSAPEVAERADPPDERPERLLIVARQERADGPRYLFARWPDWPHPAMLSLALPPRWDSVRDAVADLLAARLSVTCAEEPRRASTRVPVRMAHPRMGGDGVGWLRPVAVTVEGDPAPDALLERVEALTVEQALEQLPTEVERIVLRQAEALFD